MRKLVIGMALASSALATPAMARDDSWYVEADAGGMIVEDIKNFTGLNDEGSLDLKTGYDFGGIVGYDFGGFRLEAEASYRRAEEKAFSTVTARYTDANVGGGAEALSFMVNGLLDFGPDDGLQGFVGGGVGVGRVKNAVILSPNSPLSLVDSDTGFAWQALAGVRTPISDNIDVGLKYRFFNQDHNDLVNTAGQNIRTRFRSHSLLLTLGYNFGGAEPAPVCNKGPYI
ncbi:MAG: outer membrane protein, partial [Novosphingobium sp.]|uniref:outer membrane protein n=1 Tax=Novosphingobium sp. TaxID=1874826 RepID=UPI0039192A65